MRCQHLDTHYLAEKDLTWDLDSYDEDIALVLLYCIYKHIGQELWAMNKRCSETYTYMLRIFGLTNEEHPSLSCQPNVSDKWAIVKSCSETFSHICWEWEAPTSMVVYTKRIGQELQGTVFSNLMRGSLLTHLVGTVPKERHKEARGRCNDWRHTGSCIWCHSLEEDDQVAHIDGGHPQAMTTINYSV